MLDVATGEMSKMKFQTDIGDDDAIQRKQQQIQKGKIMISKDVIFISINVIQLHYI